MRLHTITSRVLAVWRALDRRLLLNRPRLWTMRFHHAVALGLFCTLVSVVIAMAIPMSTTNIPNLRPFFLSWLSLGAVATLYWTWLQFRVLRHVSVRGPDGGGLTFALYLACLAAINLAPLTATAVLQQRIEAVTDDLAADSQSFTEGMEAVGAYSEARGAYRCLDFEGKNEQAACPADIPPPSAYLGDACGEWALASMGSDTFSCGYCGEVEERVARLAPVIEQYGCDRAPTNLKHGLLATGLGGEQAAFNRRMVFAIWLVSIAIATALTILRTTAVRVVIEVALGLGGVWLVLTFGQTAFGVFTGWSQPLALGVCAAGVVAALAGLALGPHALLQRLLVGACLLAAVTTVAGAQAMFDQNESLLKVMDLGHSIEWFASPWQGRPGDAFFLEVLAAATVAAGVYLTLYRALAQRLAARPTRR